MRGSETLPSGRITTVVESSGSFQTKNWIWSSGPNRYSVSPNTPGVVGVSGGRGSAARVAAATVTGSAARTATVRLAANVVWIAIVFQFIVFAILAAL